MKRFGLATSMLSISAVTLALVLTAPHAWAGPTVPPDAVSLKCETAATKQLTKLLGCVAKCRIKAAMRAFKGGTFDETACASGPTTKGTACVERYAVQSAKLLAKNQCPACLDLPTISANALGVMNGTFANALYCAGAPSYPAPHAAPPQLVTLGGPVLTAPHIYPVAFANGQSATIQAFVNEFVATSYLSAATTEYGVGAATAESLIVIGSNAPGIVSDADIQTLLAGKLNSDDAAFPSVDANTLFVLFYPTGSTIVNGGTSCIDFDAYHSELVLDAAHGNAVVPYVVVASCNNWNGLLGMDAVTYAASHGIIDAVTDPRPNSAPAYGSIDGDHTVWNYVAGGEASSLCQIEAAHTTTLTSPFVVARSWSNAAALAGHDPCRPAPAGATYFAAVPDLPDTVPFGLGTTKGVQIATGQSRTISVVLISDAATSGPIAVSAFDQNTLFGTGPSQLEFTFDHTGGVNGDTLALTIKALSAFPTGADAFALKATVGGESHLWFGVVSN